jgi:hypothetical protein
MWFPLFLIANTIQRETAANPWLRATRVTSSGTDAASCM